MDTLDAPYRYLPPNGTGLQGALGNQGNEQRWRRRSIDQTCGRNAKVAEELAGKQCHWGTVGRGEMSLDIAHQGRRAGTVLWSHLIRGLRRCACTPFHEGSNSRSEAASITARGTVKKKRYVLMGTEDLAGHAGGVAESYS
ncbi:hypothetical protein FB451DRAFT_1187717 [Mycena latifolia]|nr:hypothetical protein FB451DRAFT_1187717 [Mycena latifolia]